MKPKMYDIGKVGA